MDTTLQFIGIGVALIAAVAALATALAARKSAAVAENAALLSAIPLPVPWIDAKAGSIELVNRGASDCHELEWWLFADDETKPRATGRETRVIPAGKDRQLLGGDSGIVPGLRATSGYRLKCEFMTSWGEYLTIERTYIGGKSRGVQLFDQDGRQLTVRG